MSVGQLKHWLLVMKDNTSYASSYFLKDKSELKDVMMSLLEDLEAMYSINTWYVHYNNAGENETFEQLYKKGRI